MKRLILPLLLAFWFNAGAQELMNLDSLLRLLPSAAEDTNKVQLYINLGQQYEGSDPGLAKYYYKAARELSRRLNFKPGLIRFYTNYTFVLNQQGYYDSSLALNLESVALARELGDHFTLAKTLFNTGSSYRLKEEYEKAVAYYEEGKKYFAPYKNERIEAQANDILQNLYTGMKQYHKALVYGRLAVSGLRKTGNKPLLGMALNNMGLIYTHLNHADSAAACFRESLSIAKETGDMNMEATQYLNLGDLLVQEGDFMAIKPLMEKALKISRELGLTESEAIALKGLSFHYQFIQNYPLSKWFADSALALAIRYDFRDQRQKLYAHLSNLSYSMQDMKAGERYARLSTQLADTILNEMVQKTTLDLEKKYETAAKEAKIRELEAQKKLQQLVISRKNLLNYILAGGALMLVLLGFLLYRNYRHARQLQQQRIQELEAEKQLAATEAVLKGEEQERSRLARELHDGLGGMLSGIKYSFNTMKGNLIMTPENAQAFERSMDMLDSSIKEMRRVAHNMMPEALVKFGLDTALRDFCEDINRSGALQVVYQSFGMELMHVEQSTAIAIYRIVQELINNTMKHAAAKTAIVQLSRTGTGINVTVEDDGKGFDPVILQDIKGIGWINIRSRVEYLKGKMDVQSAPGNGTSVNIEFNL